MSVGRGRGARLRVGLAAVVASLALCSTALLVPGVAHAVDRPTSPGSGVAPFSRGATSTPTRVFVEALEGAPGVRVQAISPQITRPGSTLTVTAVVQNSTADELEDVRVVLGVHRFRSQSLDDVVAWSDQPVAGELGSPVHTVELEEPLPAGQATTVTLTVDAAALQLLDLPDTWGPRGLSVASYAGTDLLDVERTFVLWQSTDEVPQLRLSVLAPLVGPASDEGATAALAAARAARDLTPTRPDPAPSATDTTDTSGTDQAPTGSTAAPDQGATVPVPGPDDDAQAEPDQGESPAPHPLTALLTPEGRLGRVVVATAAFPEVSWVVDPALVAAATTVGGEAGAAWVDRVRGAVLGRDLFALGWRDPDPSALTGDGADLQVLASEMSGARGQELLGVSPRTDLAWPVPGTLSREVATALVEAGSSIVVAGPDDLAPMRPGIATPGTRVDVDTPAGGLTALVPDAALTSQLVEPRGRTTATQAQWLLALTAVIAHEDLSSSRHVLAALPRDWAPDTQSTTAQLRALTTAPWVALTPVSTVLGSASSDDLAREELPLSVRDTPALSGAKVTELLEIQRQVTAFAPVVADSEMLVEETLRSVLAATSIAWRTDAAARTGLVETVRDLAQLRVDGLSVIPGSDVNLFSSTGEVPVTVRNDLDQEATVDVELVPDSAKLVAAGKVRVVVPARSEQSLRVPVESIANGDVHVEVRLLSPDGLPVARSSGFDMRVQAEWESVGTAVVAVVLGLLLVGGIVRTVRRGRTTTRATAAEAAATIAEDVGAPVPTDPDDMVALVDAASLLQEPDDPSTGTGPAAERPAGPGE